jgi:hypothetical protein
LQEVALIMCDTITLNSLCYCYLNLLRPLRRHSADYGDAADRRGGSGLLAFLQREAGHHRQGGDDRGGRDRKEPRRDALRRVVFVHGERWRATLAFAPEEAYPEDSELVLEVGHRAAVVGFGDRGMLQVVPVESPRRRSDLGPRD